MIEITNLQEAKDFALRAISERGWRNGYLTRLAECALDHTKGLIGDYLDEGYLKDIAKRDNVRLGAHFFSPGKVYK
jgi:hypothetical protein